MKYFAIAVALYTLVVFPVTVFVCRWVSARGSKRVSLVLLAVLAIAAGAAGWYAAGGLV